MEPAKFLIVDANALIDYMNSEPRILSLTSQHVGSIFVAKQLLREVEALSEEQCHRLGVVLVEPTLDQLLEAGETRGALSFEDRICLILARDEGWTCVTNDRRLRSECRSASIEMLWGLELIAILVDDQRLKPAEAVKIALAIHRSNPYHINRKIVDRFLARVNYRE